MLFNVAVIDVACKDCKRSLNGVLVKYPCKCETGYHMIIEPCQYCMAKNESWVKLGKDLFDVAMGAKEAVDKFPKKV